MSWSQSTAVSVNSMEVNVSSWLGKKHEVWETLVSVALEHESSEISSLEFVPRHRIELYRFVRAVF